MNKKTLTILLQSGADELTKTARAVPEDKLRWKPLDNGRDVLDMLGEAAQTATFAADFSRSRGEMEMTPQIFQNWKPERAQWTREIALEKLESATRDLLASIEGLSEEDLAKDITMTMHEAITMPLAAWTMLAYRTFVSRMAQINYIQTLYGDFDFH